MNTRHVLPEWPAAMRGGASPWIALLICALASCVAGCGFVRGLFSTDVESGILLKVMDRDGAPLSDACAQLLDDGSCYEADSEGTVFLVSSGGSAPIRVEIRVPGYECGYVYLQRLSARPMLLVPLARFDDLRNSFSMGNRDLRLLHGNVIDTDWNPIGAPGSAWLIGSKLGGMTTMPYGGFKVRNIPPGRYDVSFSALGSRSEIGTFDANMDSSMYCLVQLMPEGGSHVGGWSTLWMCYIDRGLVRDRAATVREQESDEIADRPTRALQETVRSMGSIRYNDPEGGPR